MSDTGAITLPDGRRIPWARKRVTSDELKAREEEFRSRKVRVFMSHVEHGERLLTAYDVPQDWLEAFLTELEEVGTGTEEVIGIEVVGEAALHTTN
jgi:hypothetical protein